MLYRSEAFYEDVEDLLTPTPTAYKQPTVARGPWVSLILMIAVASVPPQWRWW